VGILTKVLPRATAPGGKVQRTLVGFQEVESQGFDIRLKLGVHGGAAIVRRLGEHFFFIAIGWGAPKKRLSVSIDEKGTLASGRELKGHHRLFSRNRGATAQAARVRKERIQKREARISRIIGFPPHPEDVRR